MAVEIKVPTVGESINEVTLTKWIKKDGDWVERDEVIAELESEKATFEINAEKAGILHTNAEEDEDLQIGDVVATIDDTATKPESSKTEEAPPKEKKEEEKKEEKPQEEKKDAAKKEEKEPEQEEVKPEQEEVKSEHEEVKPKQEEAKTGQEEKPAEEPIPIAIGTEEPSSSSVKATPLAAAILADKKMDVSGLKGTGAHGKFTSKDILGALENPGKPLGKELFSRNEESKKMSRLRRTISRRLVEAKNSTAMLTTFNEVDMSAIIEIRKKYKEVFKKTHDVGLGFMSFFTKAVCFAVEEWPSVNARLDEDSVVYHDFCDISIAVSSPKGLVVPVIRNAESLSMAEIEKEVVDLATKARNSTLTLEEMTGGTFTITNGGIFGSMLSTPILNIPQSAILGMHNIIQRPVGENGNIVLKPMMYIALSYDHRVIDGRESVSFLMRLKQMLESPEQLLFGKDPVKTLLQL